jgi:transposase
MSVFWKGRVFGAEFDALLYDLTSSYVEGGAAKDPLLQRGYSRDHRLDCKQVVIALIVNAEGFPLSYETVDGNRADVTTVEAVMRRVVREYGPARRVWVFDRGVVSEENLAALRGRNGPYLVGTPRSKLKQFEAELLTGDWERVREDVEVKRVPMPGGEETYVLRTTARQEKEKAFRSRFSAQIEKALEGLAQRVATGKWKDYGKIERRLGRIEARCPSVADLFQARVVETPARLQVEWQLLADQPVRQARREGTYLLRTNLAAESAAELWTKYIQLTELDLNFECSVIPAIA